MKRTNPLKLNKLQLRTLVLTQVLARSQDETASNPDGSVSVSSLPRVHGDHVHVGEFVVNVAEITGFSNKGVWSALARKGLVASKDIPPIVLTKEGLDYDTGLGHHFAPSASEGEDACCDDPNCNNAKHS